MLEVKVFDTQDRKLKVFNPESERVFPMYVCGITPQSSPHVGHGRVAVLFDTFARFLKEIGFDVRYVSNYTDIDDKILAKAKEEGVDPLVIAERYEREYYWDMDALDIHSVMIYARVSQHIEDIIDAVSVLLEKGYAYTTPDGVYYSVQKFEGYGKLSGRSLEELVAGARVEPSPYKRYPLDFALWKRVGEDDFGWKSPWGKGRPGWHIECSVMSVRYAGYPLFVHGGGEDLIFPHHENEIAQSEALYGGRFVEAWMHVGLLSIRGEKMSKSLGNVFLLKEAINAFGAGALRLFLLSTHYRSPLNFIPEAIESYRTSLVRLRKALDVVSDGDALSDKAELAYKGFLEALANDFHTPTAIAHMYDFVREVLSGAARGQQALKQLKSMLRVLGLENLLQDEGGRGVEDFIEYLVELRSRFRKEKRYDVADEIREFLREHGVVVEDTPAGAKWWWA